MPQAGSCATRAESSASHHIGGGGFGELMMEGFHSVRALNGDIL